VVLNEKAAQARFWIADFGLKKENNCSRRKSIAKTGKSYLEIFG